MTIPLSILAFLSSFGLWFVMFRSPLLPHFFGARWGKPYMTGEQFAQELAARGHLRAFQLWLCGHCQAVWTAFLPSFPIGLLAAGGFAGEPPLNPALFGLALAPFLWLSMIPVYWIMALPFGSNTFGDPAAPEPEKVPRKTTEVRNVRGGRVQPLSPQEQKVMQFFGGGECPFEGWRELWDEYTAERRKAEEDPNCPACVIGDIVRKYREQVRVIYGFTKEQVPDLRPDVAGAAKAGTPKIAQESGASTAPESEEPVP